VPFCKQTTDSDVIKRSAAWVKKKPSFVVSGLPVPRGRLPAAAFALSFGFAHIPYLFLRFFSLSNGVDILYLMTILTEFA
jgi:Na+(H+)/acetate symporter ActP